MFWGFVIKNVVWGLKVSMLFGSLLEIEFLIIELEFVSIRFLGDLFIF